MDPKEKNPAMDMDQATARRLFAEGAFFVLLGVPEETEFGIDLKSWSTGEKFRGVKMIPPGLHFIFYSSVSSSRDIAPRQGFFHSFHKGEIVVKKWDRAKEDISDEVVPEAEVVRLKANITTLDGFLGPYPYNILERWQELTGYINENLVARLIPQSGTVRSALELQSCSDKERPRGTPRKDFDDKEYSSSKKLCMPGDIDSNLLLLPTLKPKEGTELRFTQFPKRNYPEGATPAEITQHSLDMTFVLETILESYTKPSDIIGELQFCFVCFLVGHSLEAFEQWKKLVHLFCSCEAAFKRYRALYDPFVSVLDVHIREIPEEFLADIVSNNNIVYVSLRNLFRTIQASGVDGQIKTKVERFKRSLTETYLWDFENLEEEEEDEAPVVVET